MYRVHGQSSLLLLENFPICGSDEREDQRDTVDAVYRSGFFGTYVKKRLICTRPLFQVIRGRGQ